MYKMRNILKTKTYLKNYEILDCRFLRFFVLQFSFRIDSLNILVDEKLHNKLSQMALICTL